MSKDEQFEEPERDDAVLDDEGGRGGRGGLTFLAGFVLGALLGAGTALLLAPERGAVTRRRLRRRLRDLRSDAQDRLGELRHRADRELRRGRRRLERHLPDH